MEGYRPHAGDGSEGLGKIEMQRRPYLGSRGGIKSQPAIRGMDCALPRMVSQSA